MKKKVIITHIGETKEGIGKQSGEPWVLTDIDMKWTVEQPGTESYVQSCVGTVKGYINDSLVRKCIAENTEIMVTMYVSVKVWNDRHFTSVQLYLPKEFMFEEKPL